jgi:predicted component of type VI protein secretion system
VRASTKKEKFLSRNRVYLVAAVLGVFFVAAGVLIYANRHAGQPRTINVTVTGARSMNPSDWAANQNDTVTVNITSDADGELHLHGYDIHFEAKAGQTITQTFKADKSGMFPIEWESTSAALGRLVVSG